MLKSFPFAGLLAFPVVHALVQKGGVVWVSLLSIFATIQH